MQVVDYFMVFSIEIHCKSGRNELLLFWEIRQVIPQNNNIINFRQQSFI